ncbi:MAG: hypothetical protein KDC84_07940 [Crocinitomicaceae bacterium]|nr:hypothetical protein [Crocinitomicaceae bacterium]
MKKVLLSAVAASFLLASCGPDICDCVEGRKEMREKLKEAGDDESKRDAIKEEYKDLKEKCKKLVEDASDEEKEKMKEEAKKCAE